MSDPANLTKAEIIEILLANGNARDRSILYADVYLEYREATANIDKTGAVVSNPRTGAPMDNPYLKVRDRAWMKLRKMQKVNTQGLW